MAQIVADRLNEDWTVDVVAKMHKYRITAITLAQECNYAPAYLSVVLNGKKEFTSERAKEKTRDVIFAGLDRLIQRIEDSYAQGDADHDDFY